MSRMVLMCGPRKLRRHFSLDRPLCHLMLTILYSLEERGAANAVLVNELRFDFLEPWSLVEERYEGSVNPKLLSKSDHLVRYCANAERAADQGVTGMPDPCLHPNDRKQRSPSGLAVKARIRPAGARGKRRKTRGLKIRDPGVVITLNFADGVRARSTAIHLPPNLWWPRRRFPVVENQSANPPVRPHKGEWPTPLRGASAGHIEVDPCLGGACRGCSPKSSSARAPRRYFLSRNIPSVSP